ncbi:hypothetical protein [Photobacterium damselae]|uniref:hypothetical protein n=1 Tax=Photobacterium damselae TaxID=38293 RepID=UPI0040679F72
MDENYLTKISTYGKVEGDSSYISCVILNGTLILASYDNETNKEIDRVFNELKIKIKNLKVTTITNSSANKNFCYQELLSTLNESPDLVGDTKYFDCVFSWRDKCDILGTSSELGEDLDTSSTNIEPRELDEQLQTIKELHGMTNQRLAEITLAMHTHPAVRAIDVLPIDKDDHITEQDVKAIIPKEIYDFEKDECIVIFALDMFMDTITFIFEKSEKVLLFKNGISKHSTPLVEMSTQSFFEYFASLPNPSLHSAIDTPPITMFKKYLGKKL